MALILNRTDVESLLTMKENIDVLEQAFKQQALGNVKMPLRPTINLNEFNGFISFMPAYVGGDMNALAVKVVSGFRDNPKLGLPVIQGTVLLNDARTGTLLAIMDGAFLTAMRTGAASGLATKYMARKNAEKVGIFGAGVQAETQLLAMCEVRKISTAKVFDTSHARAKTFHEKMREKVQANISIASSAKEAVEASDIVITATTSKEPVFNGEWLQPGCHINGIGSHSGPGIKEVDGTTVKRSLVVADSKEACLKEAGDLIDPITEGLISQDHIYAELSEIVTGKKSGRLSDRDITFFKSVGLALEDVSTALRVFELAKKRGIGKDVVI
jgi:alanine dehydrogenase